MSIVFRNRLEHEPIAVFVRQDPTFAANALCHQNSHHARRPDHSGRMKLNEFHIDEFRARLICQRVPVTSVLPAVAGNFVSASNTASCEHDCFGSENLETPS